MTLLNFPSSPALNQEYSFGSRTWVFNGIGWALKAQVAYTSSDNVLEGSSNLYFTAARARAAVATVGYLTGVTSSQVTAALGFTPYNSTNPTGFITSSALTPYLTSTTAAATYQPILVSGTSIKTVNGNSVLGTGNIQIDGGVTSFNTRTGAVSLSSADVTGALGFTPYNATNPSGYITSTTAASTYQPIGSYLTGITSSQVTTALGFTPYNATNPSGYITSAALTSYLTSSTAASTYQTALVSGTSIKTVNGNSVLGSGNIQIDGGVTSFNTRTGAITLTSSDVSTALGFTPSNNNGTSSRQVYTATAGQTTFTISYTVGFVDVYLNGSKLTVGSEYTAINGTSIVLASGAAVGDTVDLVAYNVFSVANTYTQTETNTLLAAKASTGKAIAMAIVFGG